MVNTMRRGGLRASQYFMSRALARYVCHHRSPCLPRPALIDPPGPLLAVILQVSERVCTKQMGSKDDQKWERGLLALLSLLFLYQVLKGLNTSQTVSPSQPLGESRPSWVQKALGPNQAWESFQFNPNSVFFSLQICGLRVQCKSGIKFGRWVGG